MGTLVLIVTLTVVVILGKFAISKGQALERRKRSKDGCCGEDCGCHSKQEKK